VTSSCRLHSEARTKFAPSESSLAPFNVVCPSYSHILSLLPHTRVLPCLLQLPTPAGAPRGAPAASPGQVRVVERVRRRGARHGARDSSWPLGGRALAGT
jgi:hypothetical protein